MWIEIIGMVTFCIIGSIILYRPEPDRFEQLGRLLRELMKEDE